MRLKLAHSFGVTGLAVAAVVMSGCGSAVSGGGTAGTGTGTGTSTGTGPSIPGVTPGTVTRVAELGTTGGFAANSQPDLRPPQVVVYSNGMVVLDGTKKADIPAAQVTALVASLAKDLDGQPPVLSLAHAVPDVSSAVLGVRQKDGSYQLVKATGLRELGSQTGYPAPILDAFARLLAVQQTTTNGTTEPYTSDKARAVYLCATALPDASRKPWPTALPQPTKSSNGSDCAESQVLSGDAAKAAATACQAWGSSAVSPVQYAVNKDTWTCHWRPALPDEK
jgi:hypothetical protein